MRILITVLALSIMMATFPSVPSHAVRSEGIAVVVNEDAITHSDVNDRLALIIASSGLPNSEEIRQRLTPQIIGALVDEQIRLQEARRLDIKINQPEIDRGFAAVAQQNNFSPEQFREMIKKGGLNIKTMEAQIRAQIAWSKVVQKRLRPQVIVSDNDVDNHLERLRSNTGKPEYLVSEIFLPIENPKEEAQSRQLAMDLVSKIREGKAPFFKVAQQFSKSAGSAQGGDLGWIAQGQLAQELDQILPTIGKGQVSNPVRTISGFHILTVRDERIVTTENLPGRDQVMSALGLERLERLQRRYLLDLKSAAFIENRLAP